MPPTEVDKFFEDLPGENKQEQDVFNEKKKELPIVEGTEEEVPESVKNRRHRRLEEKLQAERESNIALNARVQALAEIGKVSQDTELDPRLVRAFGTTDEGKEVSKIFSEILSETAERAKLEAVQELQAQQQSIQEEQQEYESLIDEQLESLEEEYNVDLTSDAPKARKARREFLEMVGQLSPKDRDGIIENYADFGSTFELYLEKQAKPDVSRQKEIASRSMQRGQSGAPNVTNPTPGFRGWMKDYNL